jgi:hypothetical protein
MLQERDRQLASVTVGHGRPFPAAQGPALGREGMPEPVTVVLPVACLLTITPARLPPRQQAVAVGHTRLVRVHSGASSECNRLWQSKKRLVAGATSRVIQELLADSQKTRQRTWSIVDRGYEFKVVPGSDFLLSLEEWGDRPTLRVPSNLHIFHAAPCLCLARPFCVVTRQIVC